MSTVYQDRSAQAQSQIFSTEFYSNRYLECLKKYGMTQKGVEKKQYTQNMLHTLWEEFWWKLPDNGSIQREPFFLICDLCESDEEEQFFDGDEDDVPAF